MIWQSEFGEEREDSVGLEVVDVGGREGWGEE